MFAKNPNTMTYRTNIKYIDPMVDYGFKRIFKESGKKNLIIRPLNAIFNLEIVDINISESEQLGLTEQERKATYDMHCTTKDGSHFIIEVQLARKDFFMERAIFYSSRTVSLQAERGDRDFKLHPVFFLGFLNFDIRHLDPKMADPGKFIHKFSLREEETHEQMSLALRFAFLEVARFDKRKEECLSFEDRFLFIMKNMSTFAEEPELWDDPYFNDLMEEAEFANMSFEEQEKYIASMKQKWDYQNTLAYARKEGREEGKTQQAKETARRMLAKQYPLEAIVEISGLSEEQVRAL